MPEAKLLFGIAALVIVGLVAWVAYVLHARRETWAREVAVPEPAYDEPPLVGEPAADEPPAPKASDESPRDA